MKNAGSLECLLRNGKQAKNSGMRGVIQSSIMKRIFSAILGFISSLRTFVLANFIFSMLVYGVYIAFCLVSVIDIDHRLGFRSRSHNIPNWLIITLFEIYSLVVFVHQHYWGEMIAWRYRLSYLFLGGVISWFWVGQWIHNGPMEFCDYHLIGYAGMSVIAYGMLGRIAV